MDGIPNHELSRFDRYILDRILNGFTIESHFNIYELVRESVSYKCILPSQNEVVMETFYAVKDYLLQNEFVIEHKEMTSYVLTGKGIRLKAAGALEKFEAEEGKKTKRSIFDLLRFKSRQNPKSESAEKLTANLYE